MSVDRNMFPAPADTGLPMTNADEAAYADLIDWLTRHRDNLIPAIHSRLVDMLYSHRSTLRPTQIRQIANAEIDNLIHYLTTHDESLISAQASRIVDTGLSMQALLAMIGIFNTYCYEHCDQERLIPTLAQFATYYNRYLAYFVDVRETVILAEQEHIRSALQSSFSRYYTSLQTAADVSRAVTSTLDLRHLITESVNLIRSHFDHYHVALYLVDKSGHYAVLRASSGRDEAEIALEGQKVRIDNHTLVGACALKHEARTIANAHAETLKRDKTLLPDTQSVMLLPLISRREIIGVLVIQSTTMSAFYDDDITRLQTVADQLANAIENARLYYELQLHSQDLAQAVELRTLELQKTTERVETILDNSPDAILLLNENLEIELFNPVASSMFGYTAEEFVGKTLDSLILPDQMSSMRELLDECHANNQSRGINFIARRNDDKTFDAGIALATIREYGTITGLVCIIRDITDQVKSEEKIKASLREKEVLLQEIHHRVKNNMQVISSLIALQSGYTNDDRVHQMFRESQSRIRSMALVHEQLYRSHDLARIDFSKYIHELTTNLMRSYPNSAGRIQLDVEAETIFLDIDTAIPCGLIINELVSNALKHAFPNNRAGNIHIQFKASDTNQRTLIVRDDGVGFPDGLNVYRTETLGMQLVTSLTSQLNATIGLSQDDGTMFEIRFTVPEADCEDDPGTGRAKTRPLVERSS
ncbi:MAG: PAS domain S-box protein [Anaerolineae bacterium]|nr:PAS domain S-box protein [Anaerolineae bacterium]